MKYLIPGQNPVCAPSGSAKALLGRPAGKLPSPPLVPSQGSAVSEGSCRPGLPLPTPPWVTFTYFSAYPA